VKHIVSLLLILLADYFAWCQTTSSSCSHCFFYCRNWMRNFLSTSCRRKPSLPVWISSSSRLRNQPQTLLKECV